MPKEKVKRHKTERYVIREQKEMDIIDEGVSRYRDENHNVYDFVRNFFGIRSSNPGAYLKSVKVGKITISSESWNKIVEYVTKHRGK